MFTVQLSLNIEQILLIKQSANPITTKNLSPSFIQTFLVNWNLFEKMLENANRTIMCKLANARRKKKSVSLAFRKSGQKCIIRSQSPSFMQQCQFDSDLVLCSASVSIKTSFGGSRLQSSTYPWASQLGGWIFWGLLRHVSMWMLFCTCSLYRKHDSHLTNFSVWLCNVFLPVFLFLKFHKNVKHSISNLLLVVEIDCIHGTLNCWMAEDCWRMRKHRRKVNKTFPCM